MREAAVTATLETEWEGFRCAGISRVVRVQIGHDIYEGDRVTEPEPLRYLRVVLGTVVVDRERVFVPTPTERPVAANNTWWKP